MHGVVADLQEFVEIVVVGPREAEDEEPARGFEVGDPVAAGECYVEARKGGVSHVM